jgi:nucleoside-diphosphate-sugar epimerase
MTVLITGVTGFVGAHIARRLVSDGDRVRVLVRDEKRARDRLGELAERVEFHVGDLTKASSLKGACDGVGSVIHAAIANMHTFAAGRGDDERFIAVNAEGSANLARALLAAGGGRFVHTSSTAAMGTPDGELASEQTPCKPRTPYQVSKRAAEEALLALHREQGLDVVIVRPCLVAGPGKEGGELLSLFKMCRRGVVPVFGRRTQMRKPLIDVRDLVSALLLAREHGRAGEIYLVHSDGDHTLGSILDVCGRLVGSARPALHVPMAVARLAAATTTPVAKMVGVSPPLSPERLKLYLTSRHIDISKARTELGYEPAHQDLYDLLGSTYLHYVRTGQL